MAEGAEKGSVTSLFQRFRGGDETAATRLWERFFPRLVALADKTFSAGAREDSEDAAQSAFIDFWQKAERGALPEDLHRSDLWNLLAAITVRKALKRRRDDRALKRGGGRVYQASALVGGAGETLRLEETATQLPAHEVELECEELLLALDEAARQVVFLRLMGYSNREIAELLGCAERTVSRRLAGARRQWHDQVSS